MRRSFLIAAVLAAAACSRPQAQPLRQLGPDSRKALGVAELFARKLGIAGDCRTQGPREHYSIRDVAGSWVVEIEPPPRPGPLWRLTISKGDYKVTRAQKIA
jgi:hypothetical protein